MKKILCEIEEPYSSLNGEKVLLFEGQEIIKKYGVKRMLRTEDGYKRFDNWYEWTLEEKQGNFGYKYFVLHLNTYSKPRKRQIIKGNNFLFIG